MKLNEYFSGLCEKLGLQYLYKKQNDEYIQIDVNKRFSKTEVYYLGLNNFEGNMSFDDKHPIVYHKIYEGGYLTESAITLLDRDYHYIASTWVYDDGELKPCLIYLDCDKYLFLIDQEVCDIDKYNKYSYCIDYKFAKLLNEYYEHDQYGQCPVCGIYGLIIGDHNGKCYIYCEYCKMLVAVNASELIVKETDNEEQNIGV